MLVTSTSENVERVYGPRHGMPDAAISERGAKERAGYGTPGRGAHGMSPYAGTLTAASCTLVDGGGDKSGISGYRGSFSGRLRRNGGVRSVA